MTTVMETTRGGRSSTACLECQRRKQKCSREWPCNHCQSRKVPHLCQFVARKSKSESDSPPSDISLQTSKKRRSTHDVDDDSNQEDGFQDIDVGDGVRVMGFGIDHEYRGLKPGSVTHVTQGNFRNSVGQTPDIEEALKVFPNRYYTDLLIQNFLSRANYYYYMLYPPQFSQQYSEWWVDRAADRPLTPELTSLILLVCACSCQFLWPDVRAKVEPGLSSNASDLNQKFAAASKKLSSTVAPGRGGMVLVQQKLLMAFWYKSESLFIDAWHVLSAAIREAQEFGLHKDSHPRGMSEFDIDMRRRLWSLLYMWDWEMSLVLCRPLIINPASCTFVLPRLESDDVVSQANVTAADIKPPSPFAQILLQCQLIQLIDSKFGVLNLPLPAMLAASISSTMEEWMGTFPPALRTDDPDTRWDASHPWLPIVRPYLHAITYTMIIVPLKPHIIKSVTKECPALERNIRSKGIDTALKLFQAAQQLFVDIYPHDAKFHFSFFSLFDTATLICSAIIHDENGTLPRRDELVEPIKLALDSLRKLSTITDTALVAYKVLRTLVSDLPLSHTERDLFDYHLPKRLKTSHANGGDFVGGVNRFPPDALRTTAPTLDALESSRIPVMALPQQPVDPRAALFVSGMQEMPADQAFDLGAMPEIADFATFDIGSLGQVWDWQSLDLGLDLPPPF